LVEVTICFSLFLETQEVYSSLLCKYIQHEYTHPYYVSIYNMDRDYKLQEF